MFKKKYNSVCTHVYFSDNDLYKQGLYGKVEESDEEEEEVENREVPKETTEDLCEEDMELMTAMGFSSFGGSKHEQTSQKVNFYAIVKCMDCIMV